MLQASLYCPKQNLNLHTKTYPFPAGADTTVYVRLERIQRYMSGFGLHIFGPEASASASAPAVTDLVYMRRFRLLFGTVCFCLPQPGAGTRDCGGYEVDIQVQ